MKVQRWREGELAISIHENDPDDLWPKHFTYTMPDAEALALANAIYLAAGKLPTTNNGIGYTLLRCLWEHQPRGLSKFNLVQFTYLGSQGHAVEYSLAEMRTMGLIQTDDPDFGLWKVTDLGREFMERVKKNGTVPQKASRN